jgi:hypothetical protein
MMQERFTNIKTTTKSRENVAKFKYLRTAPTYQNFMHQEIKGKLNSDNAC